MIYAPLNPQITGNEDYKGMTLKEYEDFRKAKGKMDAYGRTYNEQLSGNLYAVNEHIVSSAKKDSYSNDKNIRESREKQKQFTSKENNIKQRIAYANDNSNVVEDKKQQINDKENVIKNNEKYENYASFQEAIEAFNDEF